MALGEGGTHPKDLSACFSPNPGFFIPKAWVDGGGRKATEIPEKEGLQTQLKELRGGKTLPEPGRRPEIQAELRAGGEASWRGEAPPVLGMWEGFQVQI